MSQRNNNLSFPKSRFEMSIVGNIGSRGGSHPPTHSATSAANFHARDLSRDINMNSMQYMQLMDSMRDDDSRAMITLNDAASTGVADSTMDLPEISITNHLGGTGPHTGDAPIDENKERGNWSNGLEFFLSCLSYAVGLGNVWRFPYLCYRNGGGAFLIPYFVMLFFVGLPLFFMELAFGQYASEGPITIWKISPLFQGLGYAMFLMSGLVGIYYNMILAWAMFYLLSSITTTLPWKSCDNWWNTNACRRFDTKNCTSHGGIQLANSSCIVQGNLTDAEFQAFADLKENSKTASDEYFHNFVLDLTDGIHDLGGFRFELAGCLFICWTIVFVCLARGVKSMGKVVYFTALFPYFVLTILLLRGATLPGAYEGVKFYLTPEWHRLLEARVWGDAAMQIFFSLSPCWGGLITLASYNKFHNNCLKDSFFIAVGNCGTSFYAGFVIFSIIGFMAHELGVPVKEVAAEGAGLAFVAYPEAVARLPISPLWACLFFFMLLTLGIGTQFTLIETVCTTIVDTWPDKLRHRKAKVLLGVCCFMFCVGCIMCTKGGMYVLQLMDNHCASFSALIIGITEVTVIAWIYGTDRFMNDIKTMIGTYPFPQWYWSFTWQFGCPIIIAVTLIFSFLDFTPSKYGDFVYPTWANAIGWMLTFIPVSAIPIVAVLRISETRGRTLMEKIHRLIRPTADWGPKLQKHRNAAGIPKHTDSQVPLAYETADDNEDFEEEDESSDDGPDGGKRNEVYYYPDDISDTDTGGLKLNSSVSFSNETGF